VRSHPLARSVLLGVAMLLLGTPDRPTAPSPTTATVMPRRTPAEAAACHPVAITSDSANKLGTRSSGSSSGVATRVPSANGMRISSDWQPSYPLPLTQLIWKPKRQLAQVFRTR
jgi:hypothetical protein